MGLTAQYVPVDDQTLGELGRLSADDVYDRFVQIDDDLYGSPGHYDMDTGWDGLHFLLNGTSARFPVDDPLSDAVVGIRQVCDDPWIGCVPADALVRCVAALRAVDIDGMLRAVDFDTFARHGVYPAVWAGDPASLKADLAAHFHGLLTTYETVLGTGQHILVAIG
ncbi:MAG: YfbM family protein [Micrococcales bacterium]|nr:YfbM family protein [Micrococcales bacterium]